MKHILCCISTLLFSFACYAVDPITGPSSVCSGNSITLASTTTGGTWSSSNPTVASVGMSSGVVTAGSTAGTATITYNVGGPYVTTTITVNASPTFTHGFPIFCHAIPVDSFAANIAGGTWSCNQSAFDSISTTGVLYHLPGCAFLCGTDTITYTTPAGCSVYMVVTVNPLPPAIPPTFCLGVPTTLTPGTFPGGIWTTSTPGVLSEVTSGVFMGISLGSASLTFNAPYCTPFFYTPVVEHGIGGHYMAIEPDTLCIGPEFILNVCGGGTAYSIANSYGDGTSDVTTLGSSTHSSIHHYYSLPGTYSIKRTLYDGATPLDSVSYSYEYTYCRTLPVKIYKDFDVDCIMDATDGAFFKPSLIKIDSNGIPIDTISVLSALYYKAYGPPGTIYAFSILSAPTGAILTCPTSGVVYDTITTLTSPYPTRYFGFNCTATAGFDFTEIAGTRSAQVFATANISINNSYCVPTAGVLTMTFSPKYTFDSSIPAPTTVAGNVATWNLGSLSYFSPFPSNISVVLKPTGATLAMGDTVHYSFIVSPVTGDINPTDNIITKVDTVRASYDPNDIAVSPQGFIPAASTLLQYTIRFENTGNDTAHNVYVMDTLSDYVDINTMKMVSASANMYVYHFTAGGHNIVKFDFPNIKLLDSSKKGFNDGIFVYTINTIGGLAPGTIIPNRAGIYFDANEVVMTNTAINIIETPPTVDVNSLSNLNAAIYPNPATDILTIESGMGAFSSYSISNSIGQVLIKSSMNSAHTKVNVKALPPALYYITLSGASGNTIKKFVKE